MAGDFLNIYNNNDLFGGDAGDDDADIATTLTDAQLAALINGIYEAGDEESPIDVGYPNDVNSNHGHNNTPVSAAQTVEHAPSPEDGQDADGVHGQMKINSDSQRPSELQDGNLHQGGFQVPGNLIFGLAPLQQSPNPARDASTPFALGMPYPVLVEGINHGGPHPQYGQLRFGNNIQSPVGGFLNSNQQYPNNQAAFASPRSPGLDINNLPAVHSPQAPFTNNEAVRGNNQTTFPTQSLRSNYPIPGGPSCGAVRDGVTVPINHETSGLLTPQSDGQYQVASPVMTPIFGTPAQNNYYGGLPIPSNAQPSMPYPYGHLQGAVYAPPYGVPVGQGRPELRPDAYSILARCPQYFDAVTRAGTTATNRELWRLCDGIPGARVQIWQEFMAWVEARSLAARQARGVVNHGGANHGNESAGNDRRSVGTQRNNAPYQNQRATAITYCQASLIPWSSDAALNTEQACREYVTYPDPEDTQHIIIPGDDWQQIHNHQIDEYARRIYDALLHRHADLPASPHPPYMGKKYLDQQDKARTEVENALRTTSQAKAVRAQCRLLVYGATHLSRVGVHKEIYDAYQESEHQAKKPKRDCHLNLSLKCSERLNEVIRIVRENKTIARDVVKGNNLNRMVQDPGHYLNEKIKYLASNSVRDEKHKRQADAARTAAAAEAAGFAAPAGPGPGNAAQRRQAKVTKRKAMQKTKLEEYGLGMDDIEDDELDYDEEMPGPRKFT